MRRDDMASEFRYLPITQRNEHYYDRTSKALRIVSFEFLN